MTEPNPEQQPTSITYDQAVELARTTAPMVASAIMLAGGGRVDEAMDLLDRLPRYDMVYRAAVGTMAEVVKAATGGHTLQVAVGQYGPDGTVQERSIDQAPLGIRCALRFVTAYCAGDEDAADLQWQLVSEGTDEDRGVFLHAVLVTAAGALPTVSPALLLAGQKSVLLPGQALGPRYANPN